MYRVQNAEDTVAGQGHCTQASETGRFRSGYRVRSCVLRSTRVLRCVLLNCRTRICFCCVVPRPRGRLGLQQASVYDYDHDSGLGLPCVAHVTHPMPRLHNCRTRGRCNGIRIIASLLRNWHPVETAQRKEKQKRCADIPVCRTGLGCVLRLCCTYPPTWNCKTRHRPCIV